MNLLLIVFLTQVFERYSVSAYTSSLGHAHVASAMSTDAIRFNPAALALVQNNELAAGYEYVLQGLEGLHNMTVGFSRPLFIGGIGLQISEFGFTEQKEQSITLAYGLKLSNEFMFGMGSDLYIINNQRTGTGFSYGINLAFLGQVYKKWRLGVYAHNINRPHFGDDEEGKLPYELRTGLAYTPFNDILSEIDVSIIEDEFRVHSAVGFTLFDLVCLRAGLKTNPSVISAGCGVIYKFIEIDYAVEYVPDLPLTHNVTTKFIF